MGTVLADSGTFLAGGTNRRSGFYFLSPTLPSRRRHHGEPASTRLECFSDAEQRVFDTSLFPPSPESMIPTQGQERAELRRYLAGRLEVAPSCEVPRLASKPARAVLPSAGVPQERIFPFYGAPPQIELRPCRQEPMTAHLFDSKGRRRQDKPTVRCQTGTSGHKKIIIQARCFGGGGGVGFQPR